MKTIWAVFDGYDYDCVGYFATEEEAREYVERWNGEPNKYDYPIDLHVDFILPLTLETSPVDADRARE